MLTLLALWGLSAHASSAFLAPSGPMHIGPLGPDAPADLLRDRDQVDVDPETGELRIERVDVSVPGRGPDMEVRRVFVDGEWRLNLDQWATIDADGLVVHDLEGVRRLPVDLPTPDGLADDGGWPLETRFGGGTAMRTARGYEVGGTTTRVFDREGRLVRLEDARGAGMDFEHDELGLARVRADDGRTMRVLHDLEGSVSAVAAGAGQEHFYSWEGGRLVASIHDGERVRFAHDDDGRVRAIIWPDGSQLRVRRDNERRVTEIAGPGPLRRSIVWTERGFELQNEQGTRWRVTTADGQREVLGPAGGLVRARYADGALTGWTAPDGTSVRLDREDGRITEVAHSSGPRWRLTWTAGALTALVDPNGGSWRLERDAFGALVSVTDPEGGTVRYDYDGAGAIVAIQRSAVPWRLSRDAQGRVETIQHPSGATTRLTRDDAGRIHRVADPSGSETLLGSHDGGKPKTLVTRGGALWAISYDRMGRPERVEQPDGRSLQMRRDALGRLTSLWQDGLAVLRLAYRSDGLITRIEGAMGAIWGVVGDAAGRPVALRDPDGVETELRWDNTGRLASVDGDAVERDAFGNPTAFGGVRWTWDSLGRLTGIRAPGLDVALSRGATGRVRRIQAGEDSWSVTRDASGRVVGLGSLTLRRDTGGHVVAVGDAQEWDRDDRGLVFRVRAAEQTWRALHDPDGQVTRWTAPGGESLSLDRDAMGRLSLVRYPDGTLARHEVTPTLDRFAIQLPSGAQLLERSVTRDAAGRVTDIQEQGETARSERLHRDAAGRLVARESDDGAWLWAPGQVSSPDGGRVMLDEAGRPAHATPPVGPMAWGVAVEVLSYDVDAGGCIARLIGEAGAVDVSYDALGRPTSIRGPEDQVTRFTWDPLGRLASIGGVTIQWGPDGPVSVTELGQTTTLLSAEGAIAVPGPGGLSVIVDDEGWPRIAVRGGQPTGLAYTPLGFGTHDEPLLFGPGGSWVVPAGPLLDGVGLWDPVSGQRSCGPASGRAELGWMPQVDGHGDPWWSPDSLAPTDAWHDPLALLVALGELPDERSGWTLVAPEAPAAPWLPASTAADRPVLLPALGALPLGPMDPVTQAVVVASIPPTTALGQDELLRALLALDLADRPELAWSAAALPTWAADWWLPPETNGLDQGPPPPGG